MTFIYTQLAPFYSSLRHFEVSQDFDILKLLLVLWLIGLVVGIVLPHSDDN